MSSGPQGPASSDEAFEREPSPEFGREESPGASPETTETEIMFHVEQMASRTAIIGQNLTRNKNKNLDTNGPRRNVLLLDSSRRFSGNNKRRLLKSEPSLRSLKSQKGIIP